MSKVAQRMNLSHDANKFNAHIKYRRCLTLDKPRGTQVTLNTVCDHTGQEQQSKAKYTKETQQEMQQVRNHKQSTEQTKRKEEQVNPIRIPEWEQLDLAGRREVGIPGIGFFRKWNSLHTTRLRIHYSVYTGLKTHSVMISELGVLSFCNLRIYSSISVL